jgi:ATP-binding cassette subfamily C protein
VLQRRIAGPVDDRNHRNAMRGVLHIFFHTSGTRPWLVLGCLLLAGFAEAVGLTTLLPTLGILTQDGGAEQTALARSILSAVEWTGLSPTPGTLISLMVTGLCFKALLTFTAMSYAGWSAAEAQASMRARLMTGLLDARWSFFTEHRVGTIANAMSNDATRVGGAFILSGTFVAKSVQAVVYIALALAISWKLALVGIALGSAITVAMGGLTRLTRRAGSRQTDNTSLLVSYISDAVNNIKSVKTMNRYSGFTRMFQKRLKALRKSLRTLVLSRQTMMHGKELVMLAAIGVGSYLAAVVWETPISEFIVFGAVFFQVVTIVGKLQTTLQTAAELESAYWRLQGLIDRTADEKEDNPGTALARLDQECRFEKVSFAHGDQPVVKDVSLVIPARAITVLKGPSGAGKTTIIDLLTGLYRPDSGRILIDGVPMTELDLRAWRRSIGYVPQDLSLMHDTILNNVTMGDATIGADAVETALRQAGAWDFVQALPMGLDTLAGERGLRLSGGERQRIALARALAVQPKLLILDEVTSALDPATEMEICRNIKDLANDYTIIAITHRPAWAQIADHLYSVKAGRLHGKSRSAEKV